MAKKEGQFDLAVIGGGPGGYVAAIRAAQLGMKVALIEKDRLGGVCLHRGCIPAKALLRNAHLLSLFRRAKEFGITYDNLGYNYAEGLKRCFRIADKLTQGIEFLINKNKITFISGEASFSRPQELDIRAKDGKITPCVRADRIIIATGTSPTPWVDPSVQDKRVINSDDAIVSLEVPGSVVVIGGGAIGVEFAYLYSIYNAQVTLVEASDRILTNQDREITRLLARSLTRQGIQILLETRVEKISPIPQGIKVLVSSARKGQQELVVERVLVAIGRTANLGGLGLENVGIKPEQGFLKVNDKMETNQEGVYAIGDVTGEPMLAHAASAEGLAAVEYMAGIERPPLDYNNVPFCLYCQPQLARVGFTEEEARQKGYEVKVGKFFLRANGRSQTLGEEEGLVKIVADSKYGEILGVHILAPEAAEMIGEITLAKTLDVTHREIGIAVHAHPTLAEAVMEAALDIDGAAIHQ